MKKKLLLLLMLCFNALNAAESFYKTGPFHSEIKNETYFMTELTTNEHFNELQTKDGFKVSTSMIEADASDWIKDNTTLALREKSTQKIIGLISYNHKLDASNYLEISLVEIHKDKRKKGFGKYLMSLVELKHPNITEFRVSPLPSAVKFYENLGYKASPHAIYEPTDDIPTPDLMIKTISPSSYVQNHQEQNSTTKNIDDLFDPIFDNLLKQVDTTQMAPPIQPTAKTIHQTPQKEKPRKHLLSSIEPSNTHPQETNLMSTVSATPSHLHHSFKVEEHETYDPNKLSHQKYVNKTKKHSAIHACDVCKKVFTNYTHKKKHEELYCKKN